MVIVATPVVVQARDAKDVMSCVCVVLPAVVTTLMVCVQVDPTLLVLLGRQLDIPFVTQSPKPLGPSPLLKSAKIPHTSMLSIMRWLL